MAMKNIIDAILAFDEPGLIRLVQAELDNGTDVESVLNDGLIKAMDEVGQRFSDGDLFVPEMLLAAQTMKAGMELLKPHLSQEAGPSAGTVIIGTVKGDLHDIGKNLVSLMLEGAGFNVIDLGVDVDTARFVAAAKEHQADVVALSALLTTTMPGMAQCVAALAEQGLTAKTIVGGAPVTQDFADKIKAAGYASDAPGAVALVRKLIA